MTLHLSGIDKDFDESEMLASPKCRPDIQYPEGRTFGECVEDEKRSIRMINGRFVPTIRIKDKPTRLSSSEALEYYNKKLQKVWKNLPQKKYDRVISKNTLTIIKEVTSL